jgi:hypothetical protein
MSEQNLDDPDVSAALKKMSSKAMPQRAGRHMLIDPSAPPRSATGRSESAGADMTPGLLTRKQPRTRPSALPIGVQDVQQPRRQHRITILATLCALDVDQHRTLRRFLLGCAPGPSPSWQVSRIDLQTKGGSLEPGRFLARVQRYRACAAVGWPRMWASTADVGQQSSFMPFAF